MKNYFTGFHLYEGTLVREGKPLTIYGVDETLIGASCIIHEHSPKESDLVGVRRADEKTVIVPKDRTSSYKLFTADVSGEYSGLSVYIVGGSLTIVARLLEEYCNSYYHVTKLSEITPIEMYVSTHNLENEDD